MSASYAYLTQRLSPWFQYKRYRAPDGKTLLWTKQWESAGSPPGYTCLAPMHQVHASSILSSRDPRASRGSSSSRAPARSCGATTSSSSRATCRGPMASR